MESDELYPSVTGENLWRGVLVTLVLCIVAVRLVRMMVETRRGHRKPIHVQPAPLANQERSSSSSLLVTPPHLYTARGASEAFLTVDLYNGDVVSFPASIESADMGEVDVDTSLRKPVVKSLDGELGERINVIDALEMSKMVHLVYVFPDDRMMAVPIVL